jgi:hypothetical protein
MGDNVWAALIKGCLGFAHSRAGDLVASSFDDTGSLVASLFDNSPEGTTKARFAKLKTDVAAVEDSIKPLIAAIQPEIGKAKTAVTAMAAELATNPFTFEAAGRAATELGDVLTAWDAALDKIADKLAEQEPAGPSHDANVASQTAAIKGIDEPWKKPFRGMAEAVTKGFDAFCHAVLGVDHASADIAQRLVWSRVDDRLAVHLVAVGPRQLGPLGLDGASVEAFFAFKTDAILGVTLKAKLKAGLRSDKLLQKIIPGEAPTADSEPTAVTLDSQNGLTFGEGKSHKLVLPARFSFPGIELREFAIALPEG